MALPTLLLITLLAVLTASSEMSLHKRIIGGHSCGQDEHQYHVKLLTRKDTISKKIWRTLCCSGSSLNSPWRFCCGGSLINDGWILTAGHCWKPGLRLKAVLGVHPGPGEEVEIPKENIFKHINHHDIMLLKLPKATTHPTVNLPDCQNRLKQGDAVRLAGFGSTMLDQNGNIAKMVPGELQCLDMEVFDVQNTLALYSLFPNAPKQHWIYLERIGCHTSPGDSGGGVEYEEKIYGVISGRRGRSVCRVRIIDVCEYMGWINETMTNNP